MARVFSSQAHHRSRIHAAVASGVSRIVSTWREHHPGFEADGGTISLIGHSLGSLICFDMLSAPRGGPLPTPRGGPYDETAAVATDESSTDAMPTADADGVAPVATEAAGGIADADGSAETSPFACEIFACFALGSPVGCFMALRGADLGPGFALPFCPRYYGVFHREIHLADPGPPPRSYPILLLSSSPS